MRTFYILYWALAVIVLVSACSNELTYQEANRKNENKIEDPQKLRDANFMVDAKSFNILQVKLAELATTKGYASSVVNMARTIAADHTELGKNMNDVARRADIKLPASMSDIHRRHYTDLEATDRQNFDKNFVSLLKRINAESIHTFERMATEAQEADIRAFSARRLDTLRAHSEMIEEVEKELLNTFR